MPQFIGNYYKGLGVIYELSAQEIDLMFEAGVQLGYFFQFSIFSYIMTAIHKTSVSDNTHSPVITSNV